LLEAQGDVFNLQFWDILRGTGNSRPVN